MRSPKARRAWTLVGMGRRCRRDLRGTGLLAFALALILPASASGQSDAAIEIPERSWECTQGPPSPVAALATGDDADDGWKDFLDWVGWWDECRDQVVPDPDPGPDPDPQDPPRDCVARTFFEDGVCYQVSCQLCPARGPAGAGSRLTLPCALIQPCWWETGGDGDGSGTGPRIDGIFTSRFGDIAVVRDGAKTRPQRVPRGRISTEALLRALVDGTVLPSSDLSRVPEDFFEGDESASP
jgi:hypothetical protein